MHILDPLSRAANCSPRSRHVLDPHLAATNANGAFVRRAVVMTGEGVRYGPNCFFGAILSENSAIIY